MVTTFNQRRTPFSLVVSGEAESWLPALEQIVGRRYLVTFRVEGDSQLLEVVRAGLADAAVLDEDTRWSVDIIQLLRMIRRLDEQLPVVIVTGRSGDRRMLEDALRLAAFSVVTRPLALEELLRQIQRMMSRLDQMLRRRDIDDL